MSRPSTEEALVAYRRLHRALLTRAPANGGISTLDAAAPRIVFLHDYEVASVAAWPSFSASLPAASLLADRSSAPIRRATRDSAERARVLLSLTGAGLSLVTDLARAATRSCALDVVLVPRGPGGAHARVARPAEWASRHGAVAGGQRRMTAVARRETQTAPDKTGIDRGVMAVFAGLMLGSLVASLNIDPGRAGPATIVAELGGIATTAGYRSRDARLDHRGAVAGKLSDIYGASRCTMRAFSCFAVGWRCPASLQLLVLVFAPSFRRRDGLHQCAVAGDHR